MEGDGVPEVWARLDLKGEQRACRKGMGEVGLMGRRTEVRKNNCAWVTVTFSPGSWDHLDLQDIPDRYGKGFVRSRKVHSKKGKEVPGSN